MACCRPHLPNQNPCYLSMDDPTSPEPQTKKTKGPGCVFARRYLKRKRELIVEGVSFFVNPDFMAEKSEYFRAMFQGNFVENNMAKIELKDESAHIFHTVLCLIGAGVSDRFKKRKLPEFYGINVMDTTRLLSFVEKYMFDELMEKLWKFIGCGLHLFHLYQLIFFLDRALELRVRKEIILDIAELVASFDYHTLHRVKLYDRISNSAAVASIFAASRVYTLYSELTMKHKFFSFMPNCDWECEECKNRGCAENLSEMDLTWCCYHCVSGPTQFCTTCMDSKKGKRCDGSIVDRLFLMDF